LQQALRTALREAMHSSNVKKPPTAIAEGGVVWRKRWLSNQMVTGLGRFFVCKSKVCLSFLTGCNSQIDLPLTIGDESSV
jgi:hypothetical protein